MYLADEEWLHGISFVYWEIYDMLWCSYYCSKIPIGVPLGAKLALTTSILYLMNGWSERSTFNVGRVEVFVPSISSKPDDHPLTILMLC